MENDLNIYDPMYQYNRNIGNQSNRNIDIIVKFYIRRVSSIQHLQQTLNVLRTITALTE